ncbi:hypothetical protein THITH_03670 [Thioalkalivibrio paradoxus ARh 1]|uniref:Sialidase domain-containing protein n=1 Tax=Thioalkalivibrio paradoxus ARh 1 TaxID=713585 RepID=W0DMU4_9GAMM|nr:hypothetical protein THITH_03670 [Thioalkalivibrio paradoxus ARh 1]
MFPGFFPRWILGSGNDVGVFTWLRNDDRIEIMMRRLEGDMEEFTPHQVVASPQRMTPIFRTFSSGDRWFVVWVAQYGSRGTEFLLEGAWSDDRGDSWQAFSVESLRGLDVSHLDIATHDGTHIALALSGSYRFQDPGAREDVYLVLSANNGETWDEPQRLRPGDRRAFHARNPGVTFGPGNDEILVVWEDWATIRPSIMGAHSTDAGRTWVSLQLNTPSSDRNERLAPQSGVLFPSASGYSWISERFDDTLTGKVLVQHEVRHADLPALTPAEDPEDTAESSLRKRVKTYWEAMRQHDFETTHEHLDPFFRARWPQPLYRQRMGLIHYHHVEITAIDQNGPLADVHIRFTASVPEREFRGHRLSQPEREMETTERWLRIDGNWYREMREESTGIRYTQY